MQACWKAFPWPSRIYSVPKVCRPRPPAKYWKDSFRNMNQPSQRKCLAKGLSCSVKWRWMNLPWARRIPPATLEMLSTHGKVRMEKTLYRADHPVGQPRLWPPVSPWAQQVQTQADQSVSPLLSAVWPGLNQLMAVVPAGALLPLHHRWIRPARLLVPARIAPSCWKPWPDLTPKTVHLPTAPFPNSQNR